MPPWPCSWLARVGALERPLKLPMALAFGRRHVRARARCTRGEACGRGRAEDNHACAVPTAYARAVVPLRPWTTAHGAPGERGARLPTAPTGPTATESFLGSPEEEEIEHMPRARSPQGQ